jgi:hypothetical protein
MQFHVKNPKIVHQYIDGETIVLNMENGAYYSFLNSGALIWELLMKGASLDQVAAGLLRASERKISEDQIRSFVSELEKENLIVANSGDPVSQKDFDQLLDSHVLKAREASFPTPAFEKYTDMQGFLLVDPIHEIDENGWPHLKTKTEEEVK